jgi:hypothetical protein
MAGGGCILGASPGGSGGPDLADTGVPDTVVEDTGGLDGDTTEDARGDVADTVPPDTTPDADTNADVDGGLSDEEILEVVRSSNWFGVIDGRTLDGTNQTHEAGVLAALDIQQSEDPGQGDVRLQFGPLPLGFDWSAERGFGGESEELRLELDNIEVMGCEESKHKLQCGLWSIFSSAANNIDEVILYPEPAEERPTRLVGQIVLTADGDRREVPVRFGLSDNAEVMAGQLSGTWSTGENAPVDRAVGVSVGANGDWFAEVSLDGQKKYEGRLVTYAVKQRHFWGVVEQGEPLRGGVIRGSGPDSRRLLHAESKNLQSIEPSVLSCTGDRCKE